MKKQTVLKPPKIPGENLVKEKDVNEISKQLIELSIWRKEKPKNLDDFQVTENLIKEDLI